MRRNVHDDSINTLCSLVGKVMDQLCIVSSEIENDGLPEEQWRRYEKEIEKLSLLLMDLEEEINYL